MIFCQLYTLMHNKVAKRDKTIWISSKNSILFKEWRIRMICLSTITVYTMHIAQWMIYINILLHCKSHKVKNKPF